VQVGSRASREMTGTSQDSLARLQQGSVISLRVIDPAKRDSLGLPTSQVLMVLMVHSTKAVLEVLEVHSTKVVLEVREVHSTKVVLEVLEVHSTKEDPIAPSTKEVQAVPSMEAVVAAHMVPTLMTAFP